LSSSIKEFNTCAEAYAAIVRAHTNVVTALVPGNLPIAQQAIDLQYGYDGAP